MTYEEVLKLSDHDLLPLLKEGVDPAWKRVWFEVIEPEKKRQNGQQNKFRYADRKRKNTDDARGKEHNADAGMHRGAARGIARKIVDYVQVGADRREARERRKNEPRRLTAPAFAGQEPPFGRSHRVERFDARAPEHRIQGG